MMKRFFRKMFMFLGVVFFCSVFIGCGKNKDNRQNKIENDEIKEALFNYKFDYKFVVPGSDLSYNYLWEGYDLDNKFGPCTNKENRLFTYLTEYLEKDEEYYLVYLKDDFIEKNIQWLQEYENNHSNDVNNYHFSKYNEQHIIDGKYYYYCFQKLGNDYEGENVAYYTTKNIDDIKYTIGDFQLVFCATSKQAIIKENISNQETINKTITLYKRVELLYDSSNKTIKDYEFTNGEKYNQKMVNEMFNYVGEMLEVYPASYKEMKYGSYPVLGMKDYSFQESVRSKVVVEDGKKSLLLPRYIISNGERLDLLSNETDLLLYDDVFREYKEDFKNALIKEEAITEGHNIYALYDYEKVISIMVL